MMNMQKFAAHYMLSPEGTFLKWPVISVQNDGEILDVQIFSGGLKEQAGVSFFAGILLPAFIDIWITGEETLTDRRFFNRHFSQGTLIMRKPANFFPGQVRNLFPLLCPSPTIDSVDEGFISKEVPLWERIKHFAASVSGYSFQGLLHKITAEAADQVGIFNAGRLEQGHSPGLLVVRGADLTGPDLSPAAHVKWLNVPSHAHFESLT